MRGWWPVFIATVAILVGVPTSAREPDGRVALRYEWTAPVSASGARPLRVALTPIVKLRDVRVSVTAPTAVTVSIRAMRIVGASPSEAPEGRWPDAGLSLGDLAPGQTVVFDLDVVEPAEGGGILAIVLDGVADERTVHEGVGIPVGVPGVPPTIRNGAAEFPAQQEERAL